jgi:DNA-binding MarR family transcriptional regulator
VPAQLDRTAAGDATTGVVLRTFRAYDLFLGAGDLLAAEEGLTAARWQVLGVLALIGQPLTVPQIARRMGLTRQSVQASVNRLRIAALVEAEGNPGNRRSPLIRLTELGRAKHETLQRRQVEWVNDLANGLEVSELATAAKVLLELSNRLDAKVGSSAHRQPRAELEGYP